uniref:Adhesion G protein-coupled receptor F7 n=1 Tax=Kryptolebias marmoratus TaxID=37003 RepID=A0A3Q3B8Y4_KRYMA
PFWMEFACSPLKINIPKTNEANISITVITFASMDNVLPARDEANSSADVINGRVALIQPEADIKNVSITFKTTTETLVNPKCVFWNFTLFDGLGGWSSEGCSLLFNENETVSCNCNHTTSFSILMSPESPDEPLLNSITYIGVGISMGSLVICLFTEAILWKRIVKNTTSYLRHVAIVNIAVSLLVANIWFFIGAAMSDDEKKIPLLKIPSCIVATFFIHFFYLALFFWMLALALLLLYRLVILFHGGLSERSMLAIGFSLGYGGPLIIATTTIAVTAPSDEYIQEPAVCWLNWNESQALLAFLIPALLIVVINLIIVFLVINKMLTRKVGENAPQERERHVMKVVSRTLIILTPFFGLTWILGLSVTPTAHLTTVLLSSYMFCTRLTYFSATPNVLIQHHSFYENYFKKVLCKNKRKKEKTTYPLVMRPLVNTFSVNNQDVNDLFFLQNHIFSSANGSKGT